MNTPLVSVIIPARNAGEFLNACLSSVLRQTHRHLEIFVIDDGSDDDTATVARSVGDERIHVLQTTGIGASAARNHGVTHAFGDYLQFLDADDGLSPEKISRQLKYLEHNPNAIASCAWGHFEGSFEQAVVEAQPVWKESDPVQWLQRSLSGEGMMQTACWLVPRKIADAAGQWNETLSLHDDGEYFARVLLNCERQIFVDDATVYYRTVQGSLSRARSRKAAESAFAVCEARDRLLLENSDNRRSRVAIVTSYAQFAYEFCRDHNDLANRAIQRIRDLGVKPESKIGGGSFRLVTRLLGLSAAVKLRAVTKS